MAGGGGGGQGGIVYGIYDFSSVVTTSGNNYMGGTAGAGGTGGASAIGAGAGQNGFNGTVNPLGSCASLASCN